MRCTLAVWLLLAISALGQQAPFVQITQPNPPKGAGFLFQDSQTRLWLGGMEPGSEGLTYFDGSRFVSPIGNFPKMLVSGMAEDSEGGIWIASNQGVYRAFQGQLLKLLSGSASWGITRVAPNVFLLALAPLGTYTYYPAFRTRETSELVRITETKNGWRAEIVLRKFLGARFWSDSSGQILYHCPGGYCQLNSQDIRNWQPVMALIAKEHAFPISGDSNVVKDRFGCLWMRAHYETAYQCPGDREPTKLPEAVAKGELEIRETPDGAIILPGQNSLTIGRPGNWRVITPANGYPIAASSAIGQDGSFWMSNGKGLFLLPAHVEMTMWTENQGVDGVAFSILPLGKNVFAAVGDSIRVLNSARTRWNLLKGFTAADYLTPGPNHTIIASSRSNGIEQLSFKGEVLHKSKIPLDVEVTAQAPNGQIWSMGDQISALKFHRQVDLEPIALARSWRNALDMKVDQQGGVWICSSDGLIHNDKAGWHLLSTKNGLRENRCRSLAVDSAGDVWYGYETTSAFSWIRHPAASQPEIVDFLDGGDIGLAASNFLHLDRRGWLWRGTQDGLYVADLNQARQGKWLYLNRSDGFTAVDTNRRSFYEDVDGSVWFGMSMSIVHFFPPADLVHPNYAPFVFISGFSWDGTFHVPDAVETIQHGANVVAHIGSLQFDRRNALRLRYRLLPGQTSWLETRNFDLSLGALPKGAHTLEVQGRLFTGPWSKVTSRSFTVLPAPWLSKQWIASYLLLAAALASTIFLQLRRRKAADAQILPDLTAWRLGALVPELDQFAGLLLDSRFRVGRLLARGGFANVMEGFDQSRNQRCAIKVFRNEVKIKAWIQRSFDQEIAALQKVHHPNVVSIIAYGCTPAGAPYLVMEFVEGHNLRNILQGGPLGPPRIARLLRQLASALDAIHTLGICHRDLKPENVILRHVGLPEEEAVLIDFSIAIIKDADETLHGLSRAAGTFDYMAPEQAVGYAQPSSDVYSLARLVIELLTGRALRDLLPGAALDLPSQMKAFLHSSALPLRETSIDMIATALEFDPMRRPSSAILFANPLLLDLTLEPAQRPLEPL